MRQNNVQKITQYFRKCICCRRRVKWWGSTDFGPLERAALSHWTQWLRTLVSVDAQRSRCLPTLSPEDRSWSSFRKKKKYIYIYFFLTWDDGRSQRTPYSDLRSALMRWVASLISSLIKKNRVAANVPIVALNWRDNVWIPEKQNYSAFRLRLWMSSILEHYTSDTDNVKRKQPPHV